MYIHTHQDIEERPVLRPKASSSNQAEYRSGCPCLVRSSQLTIVPSQGGPRQCCMQRRTLEKKEELVYSRCTWVEFERGEEVEESIQ